MTVEQTRFLGSSVVSFNSSLGWNGDSSNLEVNLVDDPDQNDRFTEPAMGTPAYFEFGEFTFNGVVENWVRNRGQGGNPEYRVQIGDVRKYLEDTELIIADYSSTVYGMPNLLNVFGYLENVAGFGGSQVNEGGMPWYTIATAVQSMMFTPSTFGGPLNFYGYEYIVNLLNLPTIPLYFRVPGTSISLLEFIDEVCSAGCCDYFFDLYIDDNGNRVIRVNTVNKGYIPRLGSIDRFVSGIDGAIAKSVGYEARREATGKFVTGGQKQVMYGQYEDSILPFWGFDKNNYAIGGNDNSVDDDYNFTVDSRHWQIAGTEDSYTMDVAELRSAMMGYDSWVSFLCMRDQNENKPQFQRATKLHVGGAFSTDIRNLLSDKLSVDDLMKLSVFEFANFTERNLTAESEPTDLTEENCNRLFKIIESYATEYYGRKWMVRLPFIYVATEQETNKVRVSQEPADFGFIDELEWDAAVANNLLPWNYDRLQIGDGKFQCYVRFDNVEGLDFSNINPDDIVLSERQTPQGLRRSAFVKSTVEPGVYFLDPYTKLTPFAVVTLPGPVFRRPIDLDSLWFGVIKDLITDHCDRVIPERTTQDIQDILKNLMTQPGADFMFYPKGSLAYTPAFAAVPLLSHIETYGPWYALGANGKVEYEKDDSLVPWNYAGYTGMNVVGEAKVVQALMNQQTAEYGSLSLPGVPQHSLGAALIDGGPYITDIAVSIGPGGLTTDYNMRTWTPQFGKLAKARSDSFTRINKTAAGNRSALRQAYFNQPQPKPRFREFNFKIPVAKKKGGGTPVITGHAVSYGQSGQSFYNVSQNSIDNAIGIGGHDYSQKCIVSMDTLYRPVSTNPDASGIAHFERPSPSGETPTVDNLNPYIGSHDFQIISGGDSLPSTLYKNQDPDDNYRIMAFRAPMILSGWGYDTDGNLVPGTGIDYRNRADLWKTGPLDARWSNERKVWVATSETNSTDIIRMTIPNSFLASTTYGTGINVLTGESVLVWNYLNQPIPSGSRAIGWKATNTEAYIPLQSQFYSNTVVTGVTCTSGNQTVTTGTIYTQT